MTVPRNLLPIDLSDPVMGRIRTNVLIDPSPRQVVQFAAAVPQNQLRGTACAGKLLVYPAWDVTHLQIRTVFGFPSLLDGSGSDFWVIPAGSDPLSPDWYSSGDEPVRRGMRLVVGPMDDDPALDVLKEWFAAAPAQSFACPG